MQNIKSPFLLLVEGKDDKIYKPPSFLVRDIMVALNLVEHLVFLFFLTKNFAP